ncbi:MAG: AAA family ATPase, partial [Desulfosarcina sp.]|nr:AAA family ATPase [Desulfobacterales bacterium]
IQRYLPQGLTEKILTQRDRIEGERKNVTVMFCDMEGFMPLVEQIGPEAAYTIMDEVYEILIQQVNDYEGTVNEMTGDGIMALFGAPIALEEAPHRALWAARAIHREIATFNKKKKGMDPIRMRIGVHSGPVVVGTLGNDLRVEFKAVGDTVNLASRMEQLAEPETTCVTREVFKQAREMFAFENLGKKVIKGRNERLPVYRVRSGHTVVYRPRLGSERTIFSEMVGRDDKLDELERQVRKLINGSGALVNIFGEAGIGKSRLVAELKRRKVVRGVSFLEGRAVSMGRNLSFHPLIDLLKQWARIGLDDGAAEAFIKLETAIRESFQEQTGEVLPFVATLMGMDLPEPYRERLAGIEGEALEKLIRKNMRELFIRLSVSRPLVVVIDDLHWADRSSIELLESLFRLVGQTRILFINLFRPGYVGTGQRILESSKASPSAARVDIALEPLDERKSETLIANMLNLEGFQNAVAGQIVRRTGGNPYFIEEVVRSFIDEGAVAVRRGKFEVTSKFNNMTIPHTVNDVLMARIDRLDEETRHLLKVAAVIGRSFFYRILSEVAGTVRDLDERLAYLKEAEFIRERNRMEELEYLFKHALAQEVSYGSILPQKRKALHLKVADTIEKVFANKLHTCFGMLAYHYSRADNLDKAEAALIKAGEEALKTSASSEALHYYQEALLLYRRKSGAAADSEKVARLEKNIALALYNHGQYEEALEYFDKALNYYGGRLSKNRFCSKYKIITAFLHFLIALYFPLLKFRKTAKPADIQNLDFCHKKSKALGIIDPKRFFIESIYLCREISRYNLSDSDVWLEIYIESSCLFSFTGISFRLSQKILSAVEKFIQKDQTKIYLIYDFMKTIHNYLIGDWHKIDRLDMGLVNKNLDYGEVFIASQDLYWHGCPSIYMGNLDQARTIVSELSKVAEVYENNFSILLNHMLKIKLLTETRRLDTVLDEISDAVEFAKKKGFTITLLDFYSCQARIFTLRKDMDNAARSLQIADEIKSAVRATPIQLSIYARSK